MIDGWTGSKVRALRGALRLSSRALAERLGVSDRVVTRWEGRTDLNARPSSIALLDELYSELTADQKNLYLTLLRQPSDSGGRAVSVSASFVPSSDVIVAASQKDWRLVRRQLIDHGWTTARTVAALYGNELRPLSVAVLAGPTWIPEAPIRLQSVSLQWRPTAAAPWFDGSEAEAFSTLPLRAPSRAFSNYSSAIRYVDAPVLFENRQSYRLIDLKLTEAGVEMDFAASTFFDKLNVAEAVSHETAMVIYRGERLAWESLPYRALVGDPTDLRSRAVNPGIATLTIRIDRDSGEATFFLLRRNPQLVTNGRHFSLLPAGEFQPASISPSSIESDLDLWHNIVREYSEEMLGDPEHDGSSGIPIDYEVWPFYRNITQARSLGTVNSFFLGVIIDALSLNAVISTVVVFDAHEFDTLFQRMVRENSEGEIVLNLDGKKDVRGLPFDWPTISRLTESEPIGQTSAATLLLAWQHRAALLDGVVKPDL